ncbi:MULTISPECIES: FAD-dependent oxidoreductase [unclassified Variovorax]|jgi:predicted NAD/FAD-binding protein|uniref:NAD(P)/FAD-dependent oxidoreductase n=1 Tax=unclassified Variovorax TaxID=663243 RepID=UPI000F7D73CD|nr:MULTISPECIES: FAD-dependent oxidoreductase [unclassified Variovorax]RSZ38377.1 FAD-dependent oxidoreductase [Variovorax sp. 553]RSZ39171.1 FAD-dependent oxidoreductase [Variovorax sp. 679]
MTRPPRIAVVGAGISGLAAAHSLRDAASVTLLEASDYFGGHAHTATIELPRSSTDSTPIAHGVDTGFLVYNDRTYPNLIRLFSDLGVETAPSDMSFSVQATRDNGGGRLEWSGNNLGTVFAQRRNLFDGRFLGMLADLLRFNRLTTRIAKAGTEGELTQQLGDFLDTHRFGKAFREWYFLPMMGCIWSCSTTRMLRFPVATMIRFCHNHGLIQIANRPQWRTVRGGSRHYVEKIVAGLPDKRLNTRVRRIARDEAGVLLTTDAGTERFDHVVLATHSDQSLAMLADASPAETTVLDSIRYQANHAVLHTDASALPQNRAAWAAWNYERAAAGERESGRVCLHYLLNKLQPLPWEQPVVVSLNPVREIQRSQVMAEYDYDHPVLDLAAIRAQAEVPALQGRRNTWFAGAWMGYGFHEDGLKAGLAVAEGLRARLSAGKNATTTTARLAA